MLYRTNWLLLLAAVFLLTAGLTAGLPATAAAQEPNLTYLDNPSYLQYPLTPTTTYPGSYPLMLPATLPGNSPTVYFGFGAQNDGAVGTITGFRSVMKVDGVGADWWFVGIMPAGTGNFGLDRGPINVRGGRHTLEVFYDDQDVIPESDETDNVWAHQFVFTPYVLSEGTPKSRGAPPEWDGGWTSIVDGSLITANCDGFRFSSTGWWNAITLYADDNDDEYDLHLYAPSTGSEDGFFLTSVGSASPAGYLDVLIVNRNTVGVVDYDVGVVNANDGSGSFVIEQVISQPAYVGDSISVALGADEYLRIWDTWIGDTGWVSVSVVDATADGEDIMVGWVEHDATEIGLWGIGSWGVTDEYGLAWLHRDFTTTGFYGLVVYRNPIGGGLPKNLTVEIEPTPPDLLPTQLTGWHAPLVPTPTPVVAPGPAILPDTLYGFEPRTYLNFAVGNVSYGPSPEVNVAIYQDGMEDTWIYTFLSPVLLPFGIWDWYGPLAREYPGGRHVLTLETDHTDTIHEIYEDNNIYGEQYCWSPLELSLGWQYGHGYPGPASGGFTTLDPNEPVFYNCDGYRLYTGYANWEGLVLTQGPNSDYDLNIHHALVGVKDGFDDYLAGSAYFEGDTDYVLFNNNLLPPGVHDIGVENYLGEEPYTIEAVGSTNLPVPVAGHHGPYTMPISNMLHLYNIYLEQDVYAFRLDNLAAPVDWGFALHPNDKSYQGRHEAMLDGSAYLNGPGDPEWFTVDIPAAGWYGLTVFKATPFGFDIEGEYKLTILQGVSDVPDETDLPVATALAGVHPNPFNPQTTISYDLTLAAKVALEIYDVKGALVRRLVNETMPAGRHSAVWNGEDDAGRRAASGVYVARFSAGAHRDVRKLVMLK